MRHPTYEFPKTHKSWKKYKYVHCDENGNKPIIQSNGFT